MAVKGIQRKKDADKENMFVRISAHEFELD